MSTYEQAKNNRGMNRRDFLKAAIAAALFSNISGASQIEESNRVTRKVVKDATVIKEGKEYLKIGQLELEIIEANTTPTPNEYIDPLNTGVPLVKVPKEYLDKKVTENFKLKEYALIPTPEYNKGLEIATHENNGKKYNTYIRLDPRLPKKLQKLREDYGGPVRINSPYRTVTYNKKCKGKKESRHLTGQAADITGNELEKIKKLAEKIFSDGGVGKYNTFAHIDTRGFRERW